MLTPKKYPQNLHTQKVCIYLKTPKNIKLQNVNPKKGPSLRKYMKYQNCSCLFTLNVMINFRGLILCMLGNFSCFFVDCHEPFIDKVISRRQQSLLHVARKELCHVRIQMGYRGSGPPPPSKITKNIGFLSNTGYKHIQYIVINMYNTLFKCFRFHIHALSTE